MHHGVRISDSAIVAAATLSNRYITDRFLPDKAIDLMDEAASRVRMAVDSKPEALDEIDRRLVQLKIEREALKKETDAASQPAAGEAGGRDRRPGGPVRRDDRPLEGGEGQARLRRPVPRGAGPPARRTGPGPAPRATSPRASEILYGQIPVMEKRLAEAEVRRTAAAANLDPRGGRRRADRPGGLAAGPACRWRRCWRASAKSCCAWRTACARRVVGQDEALEAVADAVRRARAGLQDPAPPDRLLPVPGPHRRRQDRADQGPGRIHVRTTTAPSPASTCPNTWRSTPSAA